MASTRNKNTPSDYCLEQRINSGIYNYEKYINSQYGQAYNVALPKLGFNPSHMPRDTLSNNPVDIETSLFGIGSTNLVNPQTPITPELKKIPEVAYFNRLPIIIPRPLEISQHQRPQFN